MQRAKRAQQILDLYNQGKSKQEIMQIMNYKSDSFIRKTILQYKRQKMQNNKIPIILKQSDEFVQKSKNIINDYNNGMKIKELINKYGYKNDKSIYNIINNYKLQGKNVKLHYNKNININTDITLYSKEEIQQLTRNNNNNNNNNNSDIYDFSIINEPWKAYFIGIMLTDGCINKRNDVIIDMTDKEILELFADKFNTNIILIPLKNLQLYNAKYTNILIHSRRQMYRIMIKYKSKNHNFIKQLNRLGIYYNQATNINYPHLLPEEYQFLPYIMQGIIDGDGCILHTGTMFYIVEMNKNLLIWCKLVFEQWFGMTNLHLYNITKNKNQKTIYRLDTSIKENMQILKNSIYKDNIGLRRKYMILHEKV